MMVSKPEHHLERLPRHTRRRTYRFFSVALAVLPRTVFTASGMAGIGFESVGHGTNRELKICANLHMPDNLGTKPLHRLWRLRHNAGLFSLSCGRISFCPRTKQCFSVVIGKN
jgi:hypothetical protein